MNKKDLLDGILMAYGMNSVHDRHYAIKDIFHLFNHNIDTLEDHCEKCDEFHKCWGNSEYMQNCKKYENLT